MATDSARRCTDSAIRGLEADIQALENYSDVLEEQAADWINDALDFDLDQLSDPFDVAQDVVDNLTTTNLFCDEHQVPIVSDYVQACLNRIRGEVNRKIKNLDRDIGGTALAVLSLAERFLMGSLSDLIAEFEKYSLDRLLDSINKDQTCITSSGDSAKYAERIDEQNERIQQVIDDLPIDEDGNFSFDKLTEDVDADLTQNLNIYKTQAEDTLIASKDNMLEELSFQDFNPKNRF